MFRWFYVFPFSVYESFQDYIKVESLDGENKYDAGEHGLQVIITWTLRVAALSLNHWFITVLATCIIVLLKSSYKYFLFFFIKCNQLIDYGQLLHKCTYGLDYLSDSLFIYVNHIFFFLHEIGSWEGRVFPKFPSCTSSSSASIYVWSNGWCLC